MKITTHGDNLIRLTRITAVNVYLVREHGGFTLIDAGMSGSAPEIIATARQFGGEIRRITLTHAHSDHMGSLDALHELLPNAEVSMSAREAQLLAGDTSFAPGEPTDVPIRAYPKASTRPSRLLRGGDQVGSLEVIESPGHSPGHLAFYDHRDGTLIAGDAYSTKGGISAGGMIRWLFPLPAIFTWHKPLATQSAEALLALQPRRLATGHGKVLENPIPQMEWAVAEAKRRFHGSHYAAQKTG